MSILFCLLKPIRGKLNITAIICFLFTKNINLPSTNENMDYIYHGCALKHSNGTNVVIVSIEKCLTLANNCFWKDPNNVIDAVRTRSQLKNQPIAHWKTIDCYFEQRIERIIKNSVVHFEKKATEIIKEPFID